jgi:O-antigen chain-terminating methyltransferase
LDDVQKVARQEVKVLAQQTTERMAEAHERFARLNEHLENQEQQSENQERQLENQKQQSENQERQFSQSLQQTRTALTMQERRVAVLLEEAGKLASGDFDQRSAQVFTDEREHLQDAHYVSFEDKFRGSREDIKERLRVYLPVIKDAGITGEMLDVGSGRGEWLQLLKDEGFEGRGVDNNRVLVEQCRTSGLDVVEEDFITYLRGLPDGSLNAVTSFHLIEHLPFETLNKFLDEIIRTLKPGGVVILETPDPENVLVGSCYFYLDPTHRNPIPSLTMQFLLEARGFNDVQVLKLHPWESAKIKGDTELVALINKYFFGPFDYGIIARKI